MTLTHEWITREIIGAAFEVYRVLGYGFLEKVYQRAMQVELSRRGLLAEMEHAIKVDFKGVRVGYFKADLFVERKVIVEIKVAKQYNVKDEAQLINALKGTHIHVGLLINFGRIKVEFKRRVFSDSSAFHPC
jgi:GxxExxY protein